MRLSRLRPMRSAASSPPCSTPKWCIRRTAAKLISNFVHKVAGLKNDWTMAAFRAEAIAAIRHQVGEGRVLCGLSGGVDSSVAAVLAARGNRRPAHLRFRRSRPDASGRGGPGRDPVPRSLQHSARACGRQRACFSTALDGVSDPEMKRKTIGKSVHRCVRGRSKDRSPRTERARRNFSRRARCIRT